VIVACAIGASIWIFLRRRKRVAPQSQGRNIAEKDSPAYLRYGKFELEDGMNRRHELAGNPASYELEEDSKRRYELP
jgi:hypothetical protein